MDATLLTTLLRLLARVLHTLAAASWVGGSLVYLLVVTPALRSAKLAPAIAGVAAQIANLFKRMVNICMGVLLLTGAYLAFDRLTQTSLALPYLLVLMIKIVAALALFVLAIYLAQNNVRRLAKRATRLSRAAPQLMLVLGIGIFILGALLNILFESNIASH
jgi:uncharacterized membrane protein